MGMAAVMLLPTCAAYQLAGARPVVHAMAPMGSGRTSVELAATYINTQGTRRRPTGQWAMQYLALEAVRLELGPLRASVRLRARPSGGLSG